MEGEKQLTVEKIEVTVTTASGTFTARTKRRALQLAAAAEKKAAEEHAAHVVRIEAANDKSMAVAYRITRAWLQRKDDKKISVFDYVRRGHPSFASLCAIAPHDERECVLHMQDGDVSCRFGHKIIGVVMSGNGYPAAVVAYHEGNNERFIIAVGKCGDVLGTCLLPDVVKVEHFESLTE